MVLSKHSGLARSALLILGGVLVMTQALLADASESAIPELKISYAISASPGTQDAAPAEPAADIWTRIRAGFRLPDSKPQLTQQHMTWFAARSGHLQRAIERSRPYLYHIVEEVEKRGMPMEIALLPVIESAFNPTALSPMKASGIWQFIPSTGRIYGLDQNGWYDGRRDVVQATKAVLDYLQYLHGMFGDWELALAAYNCGEGCVGRAQSRVGAGAGFSSLKLPQETQHYVPKLVAVRNLVRDPGPNGLVLADIPNEPYFLPVTLKRPIDARSAARLADMSLEAFEALNPGFQRRVIHTDTRAVLLLPADRVETFQFNLHREGLDKGNLQNYLASKGESLAKIASRFNISIDWLKSHNPLAQNASRVKTQQTLIVPKTVASNTVSAQPAARPSGPAKPAAAHTPALRRHTVQKGETLFKLARQYNVKVADIRRINSQLAGGSSQLKPGMKLDIPVSTG